MKRCTVNTFIILIISLGLYTCGSSSKGIFPEELKKNTELKQFIVDFEKATEGHKMDKCLDFMDEKYKRIQLEDLLKGRKAQFLDEFFSGTSTKDGKYINIKFNQIESLILQSISKTEKDFKVSYIVTTKKGECLKNDWLIRRQRDSPETFGLVGAYG